MNELLQKLEAIHIRFVEVGKLIVDPEIIADMKRYVRLNKEYKDLEEIDQVYKKYKNIIENLENSKALLKEEDDPDMREMAKMEIDELETVRPEMEESIKMLLIPKDPEDEKSAIMELRAGTGGDEACIFVEDCFRMYTMFFKERGWSYEVVNSNEGTVKGYKEITINIDAPAAYGVLKFESGVHRVQRVPETESQGRVHTSAITVAVRLTHIPTGVVAECQDGRSQHKNMEKAVSMLRSRLYQIELDKIQSERAEQRKSLVSTGDRSAKIRTYNYPQGRITDHRINKTLYKLDAFMNGDIQEMIDALKMAENAEKLKGEEV